MIRKTAEASPKLLQHFLDEGWIAQPYPKGNLLRFEVDASGKVKFLGQEPKLSSSALSLLSDIFRPPTSHDTFLCVREHGSGHLWIIDQLDQAGELLENTKLMERLSKIPRNFISPEIKIAVSTTSIHSCNRHLTQGRHILFRHATIPGWRREATVLLTC